jgi:hypothetical protein
MPEQGRSRLLPRRSSRQRTPRCTLLDRRQQLPLGACSEGGCRTQATVRHRRCGCDDTSYRGDKPRDLTRQEARLPVCRSPIPQCARCTGSRSGTTPASCELRSCATTRATRTKDSSYRRPRGLKRTIVLGRVQQTLVKVMKPGRSRGPLDDPARPTLLTTSKIVRPERPRDCTLNQPPVTARGRTAHSGGCDRKHPAAGDRPLDPARTRACDKAAPSIRSARTAEATTA